MSTNDNQREWLDGLKVGDEVAITAYLSEPIITQVDKVTATQVHVLRTSSWTQKFRKKDGREIGNQSFKCPGIEPATDEIKAQVEHLELTARLRRIKAGKLSLERLRRICAILDEHEAERGAT